MAAILRDSVAVLRMRPRVIPLPMKTAKKVTSWVSFSFLYVYGVPLGGPSGRRSYAIRITEGQIFSRQVLALGEMERS